MLRSTRDGPGFDEPLPKTHRQGRSAPPTAAPPISTTLRTICEAWRESLAAHRQYEACDRAACRTRPRSGRRSASAAAPRGRRARTPDDCISSARHSGMLDQQDARAARVHTLAVAAEMISSVITLKLASVHGPNDVTIATSVASRPRAIRMRPMRGLLWRASNVYQRPPR